MLDKSYKNYVLSIHGIVGLINLVVGNYLSGVQNRPAGMFRNLHWDELEFRS